MLAEGEVLLIIANYLQEISIEDERRMQESRKTVGIVWVWIV